uniref:Uncharacterized protein n=1 Tax=Globisporangium ultimum (strain ATCC 200006 / CBS 805.95 / DAOM BR144) TaxID=431595 RepID=K3WJE8_GLOUD
MPQVCGEWIQAIHAKLSTSARDQQRAYSVNRLLAFQEYCASSPVWRVLLALALYRPPALSVVTVFDSILLQDPKKSSRANTTFWGRYVVDGLLICAAILAQANLMVPDLDLKSKRICVITLLVSVTYTALMMLVVELWMFPGPFIYIVGGTPFMLLLNVFVSITFGRSKMSQFIRFFKFTNWLSAQALMALMYPACSAIFQTLDKNSQLLFTLLLRSLMKKLFKFFTSELNPVDDDFILATMSSVNIFHTIYMTKCMQSTSSLPVRCAIIFIDVVQNILCRLMERLLCVSIYRQLSLI